jgi:hypothetical protein
MKHNSRTNQSLQVSYLFAVLIFSFSSSFSQSTLRLSVKDSTTNLFISNAITKVLDSTTNKVLSYGFTDDAGKVTISYHYHNGCFLEISHLAYDSFAKKIYPNSDSITTVYLLPKTMILNEVSLKFKKDILQKGDTTSFRTEHFYTGGERNIEELVKKMPNFSVDTEGVIYFKNKKIEKILIEGEELTGQNYEMATRTINPNLITEIQAIENYLDNPVIKNIQNGEQTILNFKVNKNNKFSGRIEVGKGFTSNDSRLSLIGLSNNWKSLSNLTANNIGVQQISMQNELFPLGSTNEWVRTVELVQRVSVASFFPTNLGVEQENINNQKIISTNHTYNIGKKIKLGTNILGIKDKTFANQFSEITFIDNPLLHFFQKDSTINNLKKFRNESKLLYTINSRNLLVIRSFVQSSSSQLSNNINLRTNGHTEMIYQPIYYDKKTAYTVAEYTHQVNNQNVISGEIRFATNKLLDRMFINGNNNRNFYQKIHQYKKYYSANIDWFCVVKKHQIKGSFFKEYQSFYSTLLRSQNEISNKDTVDSKAKIIGFTGSFKWGGDGKVKFGLQLSNSLYQFESNKQSLFQSRGSINISYVPTEKSVVALMINYTEMPLIDNMLHQDTIVLSYRSVQKGSEAIRVNKEIAYGLIYGYNDVLKRKLGISVATNYIQHLDSYTFNDYFFENYIQNMAVYYSPNNKRIMADFKLSKLIYVLHGTIKINANASKITIDNSLNKERRTTTIGMLSSEFTYSTSIEKIFYAGLGGKINYVQRRVLNEIQGGISPFLINTNTVIIGTNRSKILCQGEYKFIQTQQTRLQLLNIASEFKISKVFSLRLETKNLLNIRQYNFTEITPIQRTENNNALLGRVVLLKVSMDI